MHVISHPFKPQDIDSIRRTLLNQNGTIAYPTETFYALGCAADKNRAVNKINFLKRRDKNSPLLVLINSWKMLEQFASDITEEKRNLLNKYWPGPLTAILKTQNNLATDLNYQGSTLGFRMTSSNIARDLINIVGVPLVGTSANFSQALRVVSRSLLRISGCFFKYCSVFSIRPPSISEENSSLASLIAFCSTFFE